MFLSRSHRYLHRIVNVAVKGDLKAKDAYVKLVLEGESFRLPLVWLRDHCRADESYNHATNQRKTRMIDIFYRAQIENTDKVRLDSDAQTVHIEWKDGHKSQFKTSQLLRWAVQLPETLPLRYWGKNLRMMPLRSDKLDFSQFSMQFVKNGVVMVSDVENSPEATKRFVETIAPIHNTFFGDFWTFGTEAEENLHDDTAYGNEGIGPHTDGTYYTQTPGIQVFHCLRPADQGGETVLVDGFAAVQTLRTTFPEFFQTLCTTPVEHHYLERSRGPDDSYQLHARSVFHPVIRMHQDRPVQVRFNPYDRAPMPVGKGTKEDVKQVAAFYEAYEIFSRIIHDPENAVKVQLQPGNVIFIDNYRVLHARTAFQGARKMCGCYLDRDSFLARARTVLPESYQQI